MFPRLLGALGVSILTLTAVPPTTAVAAGKPSPSPSQSSVSARGVMPAARPVPRGGFGGHRTLGQAPRLSRHHGSASAKSAVRVTTAVASNTPQQTAGPFALLNSDGFTPPDTQVAAGPGYLLEAVNDEAAVFTTAGVQVGSTFQLTSFFPLESGFTFTDPRVVFDPIGGNGHWFVTDLEFKTSPTFASRVYMAVSSNANPDPSVAGWSWTRVWPNANIPAEVAAANSELCDQPQLGWSASLLITVSCNNFTPPQNFVGALTRVIDQLDLLNPGAAVVYADVGSSGDSLSPAQTYGKTGIQYVVYNKQSTPNAAAVIAISGRPDSSLGISATESDLPIQAATQPPPADQSGTTEQLDSGDNRFEVATWRNGILWTGGNDGCTPSGDTLVRSCLRLVSVDTGTMSVKQDFDLGMNGLHLMYPGVTTDAYNDMFTSFTVSGTTQFPSLEYTSQAVGEPAGTVDGIHMIAAGQSFYTDAVPLPMTHTHRWGDYGESTPDPTNGAMVWLAGEYTPTGNIWGTAAGEATLHPPCLSGSVMAGPASPQPMGAPVTFTASAGGCTSPVEYSFWLYGKINGTAQWLNVQPYSPSNTYNLNYTGLSYGTYSVDVWMRNQGSPVQFETYALKAWVIGGCNNATTTNTSGTTYTTTAGGVACTNAEYKVWMEGKGLGWTVESGTPANGGWVSSPTFDAGTVAGLAPGTYSVDVWVRQHGVSTNPGYYETWGLATFVKGSAPCSTSPVTLGASPASPQSTGLVSPVNLAAAGCGASAQYKYWINPGSNGGYQVLREWGSAAYPWNTAGLAAGNYSIIVWAKAAGSNTPDYDSYALYSYEVNGATSATLATNLTDPQPQSAGAITLTATSVGAPNADYAFWVLGPSGGWVSVHSYSPSNTAMWTPAGKGTFSVVVWVRQHGGGTPDNAYETDAMLSFSITQ